jgi:hypothetical protein
MMREGRVKKLKVCGRYGDKRRGKGREKERVCITAVKKKKARRHDKTR